MNSGPIIKLEGEITTCSHGINKLLNFYEEARKHRNCEIILDCYELDWIDANLAAVMSAFEFRLRKDRDVTLRGDGDYLSEKFAVLFRNGWLSSGDSIVDYQKTTVSLKEFSVFEEPEFCNYISNQLLAHRGLASIPSSKRKQIENDLVEVRNNILAHAMTYDPFFLCGQYYPVYKALIFTIVDMGVGFLQPITKFTGGKISRMADAIDWALNGNSSTGKRLAGLGLQSILEYVKANQGALQICSGTTFWGSDMAASVMGPVRQLDNNFNGSIINLWFKCAG